MLECVFSAEGFKTICLSDGKETLKAIEYGDIGIVFTDLRMPDMDGMQLCRQIKKIAPTTPVYALSAFVTAYTPREFAEAGFDDYLTKPFNVSKILDICRKVLGPAQQNTAS
ncbi:MAG: response regulator [Kiritimatiellae bacterium]|nr:response regulator [Kiritimatiellia bacterium]